MKKSESDGFKVSKRYCLFYLNENADKIVPTLADMQEDILARKFSHVSLSLLERLQELIS